MTLFAFYNIIKLILVRQAVECVSFLAGCEGCFLAAPLCRGSLLFLGSVSMEFMSISEASVKWGISTRRIQVLCSQCRIPGICKLGNMWAIPKDAQKPDDARIKSGRYIKNKETEEQ